MSATVVATVNRSGACATRQRLSDVPTPALMSLLSCQKQMSQWARARDCDRVIADLRRRIAEGEALSPTLDAFATPRLAILRAELQALEAQQARLGRTLFGRVRQCVRWLWSCWPTLPAESDEDWLNRQW